MSSSELTVVCVKARPAYDHVYVNRLYAAVERNLTIPHRFVCLTDNNHGLRCASRQLPAGLTGWWSKLSLFRDGFVDGRTLYLDLDTIICGNLDFVASYDGPFSILQDFYRPEGYGSGVMLWNIPMTHIWENWIIANCPDDPHGDQGWIEKQVQSADRLQDVFPGKFVSYKVNCIQGLPDEAAVLSFHGTPKMHDFSRDHWVTQLWEGNNQRQRPAA